MALESSNGSMQDGREIKENLDEQSGCKCTCSHHGASNSLRAKIGNSDGE